MQLPPPPSRDASAALSARRPCDASLLVSAAVELLNEQGLLTSDPDELVRLWSNQYERVGKSYPRVCEEFTPYAFDAYEPEMTAAQAAMGNGDRGRSRSDGSSQLISSWLCASS
jgi:hypothetical protein